MMSEQLRNLLDQSEVAERTKALVEAAVAGPAALNAVIAGGVVPAQAQPPSSVDKPSVHLSSIEVEGFRGIGPSSTLLLAPGPGLTLVIGRNGSGKSSFAEGLEMLMTGSNLRWEGRTAQWKEGWRNLHQADTTHVRAEFTVEGQPNGVAASRRWAAGADLDDSDAVVSSAVGSQPLESLGWAGALDKHRPFLSYNELGSMLEDGNTGLYDAMSSFLGLDVLLDAQKLLRDVRLENEKPGKALTKSKEEVSDRLASADDPRAAQAVDLLKGRNQDLDALRGLAQVSDSADAEVGRLNAIANLQTPDADALAGAASMLESAIDAALAAADTDAGRAGRLERLIMAAHEHADDSDSEECPVCATPGVLDGEWRARTETELEALRVAASSAKAAAAGLDAARRQGRTAIVSSPSELGGVDASEAQAALAAAWTEWAATPETDTELVVRLRAFGPVEELVEAARQEAQATITQRDLGWQPHARAIANWVDAAEAAQNAASVAVELKVAEKWLGDAVGTIRDERFAPIADRSRGLWDLLRHRSNVQLEQIELEGSNNKRRVSLQVTVDGEEGAALGVMSQGELNALALSLFLPRATMDESPFRFVVIDDPVQAMDPARVDGLARVLEQTSKTHQVVVFTHDDRLPESVRRLQIPAEVTEVSRQAGSLVSTRPVLDPVRTAIQDALAVALTNQMALGARQKVVPTYCRMAVEAAAASVITRRMLNEGKTRSDIDALLSDERMNLRPLVATVLFDDKDRGSEIQGELHRRCDPNAGWAYKSCNDGAHGDFKDDPEKLAKSTKKLAMWLMEQT